MRLTSKGRYAVRAILDLTFNSNGRPVRLQEISERQSISLHYLEQLFRRLPGIFLLPALPSTSAYRERYPGQWIFFLFA